MPIQAVYQPYSIKGEQLDTEMKESGKDNGK
jgi:hypothetical protein